jgi:serpin B
MLTRRSLPVASLLAAALLSFGCNSNPADTNQPANPETPVPTTPAASALPLPGAGNADQAARANNKFAWALWSKLPGASDQGNRFISPVSISQALSMTAAGTQGPTNQEMLTALGFTSESNALADQATLIASLAKAQTDHVQLQSANALWVGKNETLKPTYTQLVAALFLARVENLDFSQAAKAAATINSWVESKTNSKIKDLVPASALNARTRIVLTNAVYFKADWLTQFKKDATTKAPFLANGKFALPADMMHAEIRGNYAQDDAFQMFELPYKGNRVVLRIILPKDDAGPQLDAQRVSALSASAKFASVRVSLPKFKIEWSSELTASLKALGINRAFTGGDFTPMFTTPSAGNTAISAVLHKTFVQVDETGTEAAAATAVIVTMTAMPVEPIVFNADHPFVFQIVDRETDTILFMGRLSDPTK